MDTTDAVNDERTLNAIAVFRALDLYWADEIDHDTAMSLIGDDPLEVIIGFRNLVLYLLTLRERETDRTEDETLNIIAKVIVAARG